MKQRTFINRIYTCQCHQKWILFTSTTFLWRLLKISNIHLWIFPGLSSIWVKSQALLRVWHPDPGGAWSVRGHRGVSSKGGGTQIHLPQPSRLQGRPDDKLKHIFQFAKATTHPGEYFLRMDLVSIPIGIHFWLRLGAQGVTMSVRPSVCPCCTNLSRTVNLHLSRAILILFQS